MIYYFSLIQWTHTFILVPFFITPQVRSRRIIFKGDIIFKSYLFARISVKTVASWSFCNSYGILTATAFAVSCMTSMAAGKAPNEARGAVLGTLRSLGALARAAGPLLASSGKYNFSSTHIHPRMSVDLCNGGFKRPYAILWCPLQFFPITLTSKLADNRPTSCSTKPVILFFHICCLVTTHWISNRYLSKPSYC